MALNRTTISSSSVLQNTDIVIEMLASRPDTSQTFTPVKRAGQMVGYYNATNSSVELYIVSGLGNRYLRVV